MKAPRRYRIARVRPTGPTGLTLSDVSKNGPARPPANSFRRYWALAPGIVFLNHGSFGACPKPILKLQDELRSRMEAEPIQFLWRRYEERLEPARAEVARFVGAQAQRPGLRH